MIVSYFKILFNIINIAEWKIKRVYCSAFASPWRGVPPPKVLSRLLNSLVPYCEVDLRTHCTDCTDCTVYRLYRLYCVQTVQIFFHPIRTSFLNLYSANRRTLNLLRTKVSQAEEGARIEFLSELKIQHQHLFSYK